MPIQSDIFEVMDKLREIYPDKEFTMSRFEEVFERIEQERAQLDLVKGEFNDGKYMRVHRTISSTRMDIKLLHAQVENKIVHILEPLASIAWTLGFEYHHGLIEKMWKESMKNHAHDSIGCCCSDKVHAEILNRYILADDMATNLINFYKRKIVDHMPARENCDKLALFNLLPYSREEVINTTITIRAEEFNLLTNMATRLNTTFKTNVSSTRAKLTAKSFTTVTTIRLSNTTFNSSTKYPLWALPHYTFRPTKQV